MNDDALPLRDLHLPEAIGWWPLAPGWWVLIALLVTGLGYLAWRWLQAWRFNAPRRYALRELARLEAAYLEHRDPVTLGKQLSELPRRGMLAYAPRADVAGLTGAAWLEWLDRGARLVHRQSDLPDPGERKPQPNVVAAEPLLIELHRPPELEQGIAVLPQTGPGFAEVVVNATVGPMPRRGRLP